MNIPDLIRALAPKLITPCEIANIVEECQKIDSRIYGYQRTKIKAEEEFKKTVQEIDAQIKSVQKICRHYLQAYHGDPAGGSNSWTECLIRGGEVDRYEPAGYTG